MASFVIPEVLDNLVGWGPASDAVPEELKYLVRPKFSSTATVLLWLCRGFKACSSARAADCLLLAGDAVIYLQCCHIDPFVCLCAAVCTILQGRQGRPRVWVELHSRPRAQQALAAQCWLWKGRRAFAVRHGAGGRGGIPPCRAEDASQAEVGPWRARTGRAWWNAVRAVYSICYIIAWLHARGKQTHFVTRWKFDCGKYIYIYIHIYIYIYI